MSRHGMIHKRCRSHIVVLNKPKSQPAPPQLARLNSKGSTNPFQPPNGGGRGCRGGGRPLLRYLAFGRAGVSIRKTGIQPSRLLKTFRRDYRAFHNLLSRPADMAKAKPHTMQCSATERIFHIRERSVRCASFHITHGGFLHLQ